MQIYRFFHLTRHRQRPKRDFSSIDSMCLHFITSERSETFKFNILQFLSGCATFSYTIIHLSSLSNLLQSSRTSEQERLNFFHPLVLLVIVERCSGRRWKIFEVARVRTMIYLLSLCANQNMKWVGQLSNFFSTSLLISFVQLGRTHSIALKAICVASNYMRKIVQPFVSSSWMAYQ